MGIFWIAKDAKFLLADYKDSDQNARILIFVGRTCQTVRFLTLWLVLYNCAVTCKNVPYHFSNSVEPSHTHARIIIIGNYDIPFIHTLWKL